MNVPKTTVIEEKLLMAFQAHQSGDLTLASKRYQDVLGIEFDHAIANHNLGTIELSTGRNVDALIHFERAIASAPDAGQLWVSLAKGRLVNSRPNEALLALNRARLLGVPAKSVKDIVRQIFQISERSGKDGWHQSTSLAKMKEISAMLNAGKLAEAIACAQSYIENYPTASNAYLALALCLRSAKRFDEALNYANKAADISPGALEIHLFIASIHSEKGNLVDAEIAMENATATSDANPDTYLHLAQIQIEQKNLPQAIHTLSEALVLRPSSLVLWTSKGNIEAEIGDYTNAVGSYRKAAALSANDPEIYQRIGDLQLNGLGDYQGAVVNFREAIRIKPDSALSYMGLGKSLFELGNLKSAEVAYRKAIKQDRAYIRTYAHLGYLLFLTGRLDEAQLIYEQALAMDASDVSGSCLLYMHAYTGRLPSVGYISRAKEWEQKAYVASIRREASSRAFVRTSLKNRRLRIGYVSGDFYQHAVAIFFEAMLAFHDAEKVEIFAYSTNPKEDQVTNSIRNKCTVWRNIFKLNDDEARNLIEIDHIDVLIDLSGHTSNNRLGVFARRAAPIQAHYLGYCGSTGLAEMDYFIGDEVLTPESSDIYFSEKIWRLPRVWLAYQGVDTPKVALRSRGEGVPIVLGSYNNLPKINAKTIALWSRILQRIPNSILMLKTKDLKYEECQSRISQEFEVHGIGADRLRLMPQSESWVQHMEAYGEIDIALDPIGGMGGGTTTCDALWMGVPVVALQGEQMAERMTASMLTAIDRREWIATEEEEYVEITARIANNYHERAKWRAAQRVKMRESPLCNVRDLTHELISAYIQMFELWYVQHDQNS